MLLKRKSNCIFIFYLTLLFRGCMYFHFIFIYCRSRQAKLKAHIHDPNAPELVHFLFTPLSLIFEASRDPSHGSPDLAANVVSPLLTSEARELLMNCLTSKETDLWMSMGEAWHISKLVLRNYCSANVEW